MVEKRGSIAFFTTYRPPVALDIYSCPLSSPTTKHTELTDGDSYNCNGHAIPPQSLKHILKTIIKREPARALVYEEADIDDGRLTGMIFVSERTDDLETLHVALYLDNMDDPLILNLAHLYSSVDPGVRMEDSACFGGAEKDYLVYVTTKDVSPHRRQPWNTVYKTCLKTGDTQRLTPSLQADLSPSVSPSGMKIAVASFQKRGWYGEREKLKTDIFLMDINKPYKRTLLINDGGWPTWGSDNVIFFHRRVGNKVGDEWGVFRAEISNGLALKITRVTPDGIHAVTPAAIDANRVAVATIHKSPGLKKFNASREASEYRQIEVFDYSTGQHNSLRVTAHINPLADHYNPFILQGRDGQPIIGYNRCKIKDPVSRDDVRRKFDKVKAHNEDVGLFRVSGVFPTFSSDGSKLAFVDNNFKAVWLADDKGLRKYYQLIDDNLFSPVWNQKSDSSAKDVLYVCVGPPFSAKATVNICSIVTTDSGNQMRQMLTNGYNNAFPSTSPDGKKLVYRSTRDHHNPEKYYYKNLYIMEDVTRGDREDNLTRLTNGKWTDTHCKWSPRNDWIVFASNRDRPEHARKGDEELDSGYYSVYLVSSTKIDVVVRVMTSGSDLSGHVNHPFFSPDGRSLVVTSDIAAVSADPMSLPLFLHSARPYGDIFTVDIDPDDISNNKDLTRFTRVTHTRYENATGTWTKASSGDPSNLWDDHIKSLPVFSSAPWLTKKEKMVVASKMSTAAATLLFLFPIPSLMLLTFMLLSSLRFKKQ